MTYLWCITTPNRSKTLYTRTWRKLPIPHHRRTRRQ